MLILSSNWNWEALNLRRGTSNAYHVHGAAFISNLKSWLFNQVKMLIFRPSVAIVRFLSRHPPSHPPPPPPVAPSIRPLLEASRMENWKTGKLENWKSIKENSRIRKNKTTINNGMNRNGAVSLLSVCLFLPLLRCSLPLPSVAPSIFACFNMSNFWNLPPWEIYSFDWPEHMLALSLTLFLFLYIYIYIYIYIYF